METRKIQVTGGSTYTVSLPKPWANENDVSNGTVVEIHSQDDALIVTPETDVDHQEGSLDVSTLEGEQLTRAVLTMYVSGFDIIRLRASKISREQRRAIRGGIKGLIGVEVVEEQTSCVVVQDLLDSSELSIVDAVTRMRLIATSMLEDAIAALVENDDDLAREVIERDDDIDRLWLAVSRIFRTTLRSPQATEELGVPREDCFDYHSSSRQLERIADHAVKIAELALKLEELPDEIADAFLELAADASDIIGKSMDALFAEDGTEATTLSHDALESIEDIDDHNRNIDEMLRAVDPVRAQSVGLVLDSLSRCADYGGNIAEVSLQKASPKP